MAANSQAPTEPGLSTNSIRVTFSLPLPAKKTFNGAISGRLSLPPAYSEMSEIAAQARPLYKLARGQNNSYWISFLVNNLLWP